MLDRPPAPDDAEDYYALWVSVARLPKVRSCCQNFADKLQERLEIRLAEMRILSGPLLAKVDTKYSIGQSPLGNTIISRWQPSFCHTLLRHATPSRG